MNKIKEPLLNSFRYNGVAYSHSINTSDDSTNFRNENNEILMSIDSRGHVTLFSSDKCVAYWRLDEDGLWSLYDTYSSNIPRFLTGNRDLIKAEMKYFKHWLDLQFQQDETQEES